MRPDMNNISPEAKSIMDLDVSSVAKLLQRAFPVTWQRMFTKSIESPTNYYSAKTLPVGLTGSIEEARSKVQIIDSNVGIIAGILEQYNFPLYYISAPLIEALKHSQPPKSITWNDITFPFEALAFMLPRGSITEPKEVGGQDIICIGVARLPANTTLHIPTIQGDVMPVSEDRISVFWMVAPSGLVVNDTTFPRSHPLEPLVEWIEEKTAHRTYNGPDTKFSAVMAGLVANFILVMEARKEWVETGKLLRRRSHEKKADLWSPTFIGRNYAVIRKDKPKEDSKAHFTELGWRAGHFKRQRFGPRSEEVKTIFVEPYIAFTRGLVVTEGASCASSEL